MKKEKQEIELNKLKAKYAAFFFSKNNEEEDERRRLKILHKQMDRVNQRRKQFRTYSD
jgi:predicted MPP superfamily phosphohydrolase